MSSTRFTQQHIIELNEKPASSLLMNKELQNIYKGTNELDDEAKIHRAKQADPTLADTATEKHVTNAQTKKWEDTANTFSGVSPSSFVAATEVVTTATANKILKLNADGKLPADIVGNATTASDSLLLNGKSDTAFQEVAEKDQPGGYAGLDENGLLPSASLNSDVYKMGNVLGTVSQVGGVPTGAIMERGSNANGEYIRFADGTQICTGEGTWTTEAVNVKNINPTMPASFLNTTWGNVVFISSPGKLTICGAFSPTSGLYVYTADETNLAAGIFMTYYWIVVGRWF